MLQDVNPTDMLMEAADIKNQDIRTFTLDLLSFIPESVWRIPASRNHHLADERGKWGNLLHTLRVIKSCHYLCEAFTITNSFADDRDCLLSATILHDSRRRGENDEFDYTVDNHPYLIRQLAYGLSSNGSIYIPPIVDNRVFPVIEMHMGKWNVPRVNWSYTVSMIMNNAKYILKDVYFLGMMLHIADFTDARLVVDILDVKLPKEDSNGN